MSFTSLPPTHSPDEELARKLSQLPPHELVSLKWQLQRRPKQIPPDPLPFIWFLLGGRGSGKTLTGANHVYEIAKSIKTPPGKPIRVALISETFTDVRITMIEGETGLRSIIPSSMEIAWNRSLGELKVAIPGPVYKEIHFFAYSSERPDLLRGPQHHIVWLDEPAKLKDADKEPTDPSTTWSNMMMGLRLGNTPHCVVTGTPEPHKLIKYLINHPDCVTHVMSSLENRDNLPQHLLSTIDRLPKTSRTYRQEVLAEILLDNPDSIFDANAIEDNRADPSPDANLHLVLGYDPSMTGSADSDEAGIVLGGFIPEVKEMKLVDGKLTSVVVEPIQAYVLEDHSGHYGPKEQIAKVVDIILDRLVPEVILEQNQGAGFVLNNLKSEIQNREDVKEFHERELRKKSTKAGAIKRWRITVIFKDKERGSHTFVLYSIHAKINKVLRADSVSIRYETGQVHHPVDGLPICDVLTCKTSLEDQMVLWDESKKDSPDRMDACVYLLLHIFGAEHALSSKKDVRIHTPARNSDVAEYDPRTTVDQAVVKDLSRHSKAYTIDIGGIGGTNSSRLGIAGPR